MTRTFLTRALAGAILFAAAATTAGAQTSPTAEGTTITNTATASFTDANGNTYSNVTANVAVTVGFKAGVDAASPATQTPVAGSTNNTLAVTITNNGNGTDQFTLAVTPPTGVTITGYTFGSTTHPSLAALNAALGAANVAAGANTSVTIVYSVASSTSGTGNFAITATSVRSNTTSDATTTQLNFTAQAVVDVAADAATSARLPSKDATQTYTQTFTISNTGSASGDFTIGVSGSANIATATLSATTATIAAGANTQVTVTYTVLSSAAMGATGTITVTATGTGTTPATVTDNAVHTVTVQRAQLTMTKAVFRADGTTAIGAGTVQPGETITYVITVQNTGTAPAATLNVSDPLPAQVNFGAAAGSQDGWTVSQSGGTVSATRAALAVGESRTFSFTVTVK